LGRKRRFVTEREQWSPAVNPTGGCTSSSQSSKTLLPQSAVGIKNSPLRE
jgi:hypothetical protein